MWGNKANPKEQQAVRSWTTAEQRLYPAILNSPVSYDRYLAVVRGICDELGSVQTVQSLVDAYDQGLDIAADAARTRNLPLEGLNLDLAAGAAFCLRYREVLSETRRNEIQRRVQDARARGDNWVALEETRPWPEMPFPPWRSVEMHLPDGVGLHTWAEEAIHSEGDGIEYGVEVVRLDPETGQWLADGPVTERQTFTDYQKWQEALVTLKAHYDG